MKRRGDWGNFLNNRRQATKPWQVASVIPLALAVSSAFAEPKVLSATALGGPAAAIPQVIAPNSPANQAVISNVRPRGTQSVPRIESETSVELQTTSYTPSQTARVGSQPTTTRSTPKVLVETQVQPATEADRQITTRPPEADALVENRSTRRTLTSLSVTTLGDTPKASDTEPTLIADRDPRIQTPPRQEPNRDSSQATSAPVAPDIAEVTQAEANPTETQSNIPRSSAPQVVSETVIGTVRSDAVVVQDDSPAPTVRQMTPSIPQAPRVVARPEEVTERTSDTPSAGGSPVAPEVADHQTFPVQIDTPTPAASDSVATESLPATSAKPEAPEIAINEPGITPEQLELPGVAEPTPRPTEPSPAEITLALPPEPPAPRAAPEVKTAVPVVPEDNDATLASIRENAEAARIASERTYTVDDPFMISQMNPNRRLQETDLPLFDESMPVIDDDIARLQLKQWQELILSAVESNPATRVALFSERAAAAGVDERAAALYPQVSLGVSSAVERSVRDGERVPSMNGMEADNRMQVSPELTIRQLLFDGGATRSRVNAAEGQRTVASKQREATEQNVAIQAADTLIALAKTQEQLQIAEAHLTEVERIRDMIRERVNAGRDAPSEMISINARVFEARNRIREIQTEQAAATAEFREVFAAPPVILAFPDVFAPIPLNPRTGFDMAMAFNPEIQASQAAIDVALAEFDASKGDGLPRIEVEASATGFDTFNRGDDYYDSSIGLRMTADLFDGGRQEAAVQRALNNLESARFRHDQTVNAVERIVNAAYSERVNLIPQFKASQAKRDQEIASREAYIEQWLAGRRPLNDLLAAQDRVFQNSLEAIELKSELHRQHFFILSLIGDLDRPTP